MTKYQEKFMNNLSDNACNILTRYSKGEQLSDNEVKVLQIYLKEMHKGERISPMNAFLGNISQLLNFAKSNFSGIFNLFGGN